MTKKSDNLTCSATIPPPSAPPFSKRGIGWDDIERAAAEMTCSATIPPAFGTPPFSKRGIGWDDIERAAAQISCSADEHSSPLQVKRVKWAQRLNPIKSNPCSGKPMCLPFAECGGSSPLRPGGICAVRLHNVSLFHPRDFVSACSA